ncbi:MAG TPA: hypothetical protein VLI69_08135 [Gammaproteobacteria bacterium]|nr:hypothetical protein [Gammaproteobacteria bacterium]
MLRNDKNQIEVEEYRPLEIPSVPVARAPVLVEFKGNKSDMDAMFAQDLEKFITTYSNAKKIIKEETDALKKEAKKVCDELAYYIDNQEFIDKSHALFLAVCTANDENPKKNKALAKAYAEFRQYVKATLTFTLNNKKNEIYLAELEEKEDRDAAKLIAENLIKTLADLESDPNKKNAILQSREAELDAIKGRDYLKTIDVFIQTLTFLLGEKTPARAPEENEAKTAAPTPVQAAAPSSTTSSESTSARTSRLDSFFASFSKSEQAESGSKRVSSQYQSFSRPSRERSPG